MMNSYALPYTGRLHETLQGGSDSVGRICHYSLSPPRKSSPDKPIKQELSSSLGMSPESCAKIAVKLDNLTDGEESTTAILDLLKNLIDEQHNIQMMDQNVKKGYRKNRVNKVHPELVPYGRQPTVSFILYSM
ncbi:uncharacterized protein LOC113504233 isoform X2 [Trichoplusia ni]|uniref:Uncharacterized protein LOC113504233 isoform X2 n=1 Tax=Trichoplusia ni TaxID=7111 RepID=A0A7E5WPX6_TRINI|nr:uncharacterized protein LOC113504233 isoform X2 [Trichoplusia ni]